MAEKIGGLTVELSGEAKGLIDAVKSSTTAMSKLIPSVKSMAGAVALGNAAWAAARQGMSMAKAATVDLVASSLKFIDANNDIAAKTGISTASLGMLEYAAKMNGTTFDGLTKSVGKMIRAVGEVQSGNDGAGKSFEALGISLEQVKSLSTEDLLGAVADGIKDLPTTAMQAAAAIAIFGKSGADMLPMLQGGSAGIAQMTSEASDLGLMIGSIDSAKVAQANDAIDKMKFLFRGIGNVLAVEVAPLIEGAVKETLAWADSGKGLRENVGGAFEFILEGAAKVADFTMLLREGFHRVAAIVESAFALIPKGLEMAMDGVIATVNGAITATNALPGVDIGLIAPREDAFSASKQILDNAKEHIKKAEELASEQGKYGETVRDWIRGARDAAQATAEANAANAGGVAPEEDPVSDAMNKSAESMIEKTRTPMEQYAAKLKEISDLASAGLIDNETKTRAMADAWGELEKASGDYKNGIDGATGSVEDLGKALSNLGSGSEVDLAALTSGAQIVGSGMSGGGLDTSGGFQDLGAAGLKALQFDDAAALKNMQFDDAAALKNMQFDDAAALKDYQFSDADALRSLQSGEVSSGAFGMGSNDMMDSSGLLSQIRDLIAQLVSQPNTVKIDGGSSFASDYV